MVVAVEALSAQQLELAGDTLVSHLQLACGQGSVDCILSHQPVCRPLATCHNNNRESCWQLGGKSTMSASHPLCQSHLGTLSTPSMGYYC